jgi:prepilin-type N-terminal cleavage/methylation domain-containing protein
MKSPTTARRGFSITEILVVISVIVVLLGLLLPALAGIRKSGLMTKSMANMRQIGTWMGLYAGDNRDFVVPSRFNYREDAYTGKVRSVITTEGSVGQRYRGTWADILWTVFELGAYPEATAQLGHDYQYDSPDKRLYEYLDGDMGENPLRSAAANSRNTHESLYNLPTPYGCGASESGLPGYFAANNFFNADAYAVDPCTNNPIDPNWFTKSQIRMPERSMYLVDSFAGETIEALPPYYQFQPTGFGGSGGGEEDLQFQVDFRYADMCLMLFLDGHVEPQGQWDEICDLEAPGGRGVRIRELTRRGLSDGLCP